MASVLCESCATRELEALPEFEDEYEAEDELEGEYEGEDELEEEYEGEDESEDEAEFGALGNIVGSLLGEQEFEDEDEGEDEYEGEDEFEEELSPIRKIYPDAMMEHLGELAAEAETEEEAAEHFLPLMGMAASKLLPVAAKALAPLAKKALPRIAKAVTRVTPHLTRGVGTIARGLHRQPTARGLLRAVPSIARRTVHSIARQASHGRRVTPRAAMRALAHHTRRVLGSPQIRRRVLRQHNRMEKHLHRRFGRRMMRPHGHFRWVWRWINGRRVRVRVPHTRQVRGAGMRRVIGGGPAAPGRVRVARGGVAGRTAGRGRIVGGRCICAPCPACGGSTAPASGGAPVPNYCRCCGQLIR
jgi:hypothetical protein